jgi:hypothetical protein
VIAIGFVVILAALIIFSDTCCKKPKIKNQAKSNEVTPKKRPIKFKPVYVP